MAILLLLVCTKILNEVKNVVLNGSVIIFDSTKSDELKTEIRNSAENLKLPTISYNYCLDAHQCEDPKESNATTNYHVSVSMNQPTDKAQFSVFRPSPEGMP